MGRSLPLGIVAAFACAAPAHACSIAASPPTDRVAAADRAVFGHVLWVHYAETADGPEQPGGRRYVAKVRVTRVYKGRRASAVRIRSTTDTGICGLGTLRPRQALGLVLRHPGPPFEASAGSLITRAELDEATDGAWKRPR